MSGLCQHRRRYIAIGLMSTGLLFAGPAIAWADSADITLDFVRHAQSVSNQDGIIDTVPPGTGLTALGDQQAQTVAESLYAQYGHDIAGIYSSDELRAIETAGYLAALPGMPDVQQLAGLDEINAGIYEGQPVDSLAGILYLMAPISWSLGNELVPIPGSPDVNGFVFDQRFTDAVDAIYNNTVTGAGPSTTDIAYSSEGAMTTWTMMNVNNPDFPLLLSHLLTTGQFVDNTDQIVVTGDPTDGWTLVSFDGQPVPPASLPTELFVDFRNLIEAPQLAGWEFYEAALTGNSATIDAALQTGINQLDTALTQFPVAVFDDILGALTGTTPADAGALVGEAFAGL
jgi:broad specificity phosphatase PhoE